MPLRLPIQRKLFLSHFLAVVLVSGSVGTYFYVSAVKSLVASLRARLQNSAALVSQAIDAQSLAPIQGPEDTGTEAYQNALALLRAFKHTNEDIAFLYIMRLEGERVMFVVDSAETPEFQHVRPGCRSAHPPPCRPPGQLPPCASLTLAARDRCRMTAPGQHPPARAHKRPTRSCQRDPGARC